MIIIKTENRTYQLCFKKHLYLFSSDLVMYLCNLIMEENFLLLFVIIEQYTKDIDISKGLTYNVKLLKKLLEKNEKPIS